MPSSYSFKWPTKLTKFGIHDPFLKILVAKYEHEIPWQSQVRCEADLRQFVVQHMLPQQLQRITFPPRVGAKHCFVAAKDVNVDVALNAPVGLADDDISHIRQIRASQGDAEAAMQLATMVNERKASAFGEWQHLFSSKYRGNEPFALLLIRPLLDSSPAGSRRTVVPAIEEHVAWLYRRIQASRVLPNQNLLHLYNRRLAGEHGSGKVTGWRHIARGANASLLAATSRGSGWCVASREWAARYLGYDEFFIFISDGKPVVALRVSSEDGEVLECQGRWNISPHDWYADIFLFINSMNLTLSHRATEASEALNGYGNLDDLPWAWWQERIQNWPFAQPFVPKRCIPHGHRIEFNECAAYLAFPNIDKLLQRSGIYPEFSDWVDIVSANPERYQLVPAEMMGEQAIQDACTKGWIKRVEGDDISLNELSTLPEFVKSTPAFKLALGKQFPESIKRQIRTRAKTAKERLKPLMLEAVLPYEINDMQDIAVEHAVNQLLCNNSPDFSDVVFDMAIRDRNDFQQVRQRAWSEAIQAQPPQWFALPQDLRDLPVFTPDEAPVSRVNLSDWCDKIVQKPWLLTQKNGVPKAIRFHRQVLEAYLKGWVGIFTQTPWKIWVSHFMAKHRVYASYAILEKAEVIDAFAIGWRNCRIQAKYGWEKASSRMRDMPFMQLAMLKSLGLAARLSSLNTQDFNTCQDILKRHDKSKPTEHLSAIELEVRKWLQHLGFLGNMARVLDGPPLEDLAD